jgi:uncharacterized protein YecE (DUF72 family)
MVLLSSTVAAMNYGAGLDPKRDKINISDLEAAGLEFPKGNPGVALRTAKWQSPPSTSRPRFSAEEVAMIT